MADSEQGNDSVAEIWEFIGAGKHPADQRLFRVPAVLSAIRVWVYPFFHASLPSDLTIHPAQAATTNQTFTWEPVPLSRATSNFE
jgi:hypothetical protein